MDKRIEQILVEAVQVDNKTLRKYNDNERGHLLANATALNFKLIEKLLSGNSKNLYKIERSRGDFNRYEGSDSIRVTLNRLRKMMTSQDGEVPSDFRESLVIIEQLVQFLDTYSDHFRYAYKHEDEYKEIIYIYVATVAIVSVATLKLVGSYIVNRDGSLGFIADNLNLAGHGYFKEGSKILSYRLNGDFDRIINNKRYGKPLLKGKGDMAERRGFMSEANETNASQVKHSDTAMALANITNGIFVIIKTVLSPGTVLTVLREKELLDNGTEEQKEIIRRKWGIGPDGQIPPSKQSELTAANTMKEKGFLDKGNKLNQILRTIGLIAGIIMIVRWVVLNFYQWRADIVKMLRETAESLNATAFDDNGNIIEGKEKVAKRAEVLERIADKVDFEVEKSETKTDRATKEVDRTAIETTKTELKQAEEAEKDIKAVEQAGSPSNTSPSGSGTGNVDFGI